LPSLQVVDLVGRSRVRIGVAAARRPPALGENGYRGDLRGAANGAGRGGSRSGASYPARALPQQTRARDRGIDRSPGEIGLLASAPENDATASKNQPTAETVCRIIFSTAWLNRMIAD